MITKDRPLRILIINPFGIGDVLFTTPVITAIRDNYPNSFIGYWCNERVEAVLKNNPYLNITFALSRGDLKKIYYKSFFKGIVYSLELYSKIKKEKFDIALDYSLDHRYGLVSKLAGIKKRVGYNYKRRGRFLTDKLDLYGYSDKHVVEYYLELLELLNIKPRRFNLELYLSESSKRKAKEILYSCGINDSDLLIGIAPGAGASWGEGALLKHWPAINFAQLIDRIIDNFDAKILILGDNNERYIADKIMNITKNRVIDLVGKTSLEDFLAVISKLKILITNDGGPLHVAVSLGIKTVSIFGPVNEMVYGPYPASEEHIVVKKNIDCRPCYREFKIQSCTRKRECINSITIEEVFDAVRRLLSQ
jgi:heptosyltransferase-2